jgi:Ser/Thr protein kinase RdoA (MazF antagonist)
VAYAPEKSATVRIDGPGGRAVAFAKAYADSDDGERTQRVHEALVEPAALAGLTLPRATGWSAPRRTLGCEAIAGRPLASLAGVGLLDGLEGLGAALGVLHGLEPPGVAPPFGRTSRARLREAAGVIARARPDCGTAAEWLLARLERDAPPPGPTVCLHGDVHPKNAIVTPGGVALIDLDQVSSGPAAADLGSIIAALRYARVTAVMSTAAERAQGDAVLRGYAGVRELPDADELRWQVAAALLGERALRAVTRLRAPGLMRLPALLAEAGTTLRERNGALA